MLDPEGQQLESAHCQLSDPSVGLIFVQGPIDIVNEVVIKLSERLRILDLLNFIQRGRDARGKPKDFAIPSDKICLSVLVSHGLCKPAT